MSNISDFFPSLGPDIWEAESMGEIRDHFNGLQPRFVYEDVAGRGSSGIAYRVRQKRRGFPSGSTRRLVVKRALGEADDMLRNEIRWLKELAGSEHVVRLVASQDGSKKRGRVARWVRRMSLTASRGGGSVKGALVGLQGPVLVMEYLENGDLGQLFCRTIKYGLVVPNRVLWSIFLCLVRACIAMAYPRKADVNAEEPRLEEIPGDGRLPSNLDHGDLHMGNVMIGGHLASPSSGGEHELVPVLKLIDFGQAKENENAVQENLFNISKIMINFITRQVVQVHKTVSQYQGYHTHATEILPPLPPLPEGSYSYKYAKLDPALRDLIARCLAQEPGQRPGLVEMLRITTTQAGVLDKTGTGAAAAAAASYLLPAGSNSEEETDDAIRGFLQKALYDAEDDVVEKGGMREEPFGTIGDLGF